LAAGLARASAERSSSERPVGIRGARFVGFASAEAGEQVVVIRYLDVAWFLIMAILVTAFVLVSAIPADRGRR
jgi:hypothetical protein